MHKLTNTKIKTRNNPHLFGPWAVADNRFDYSSTDIIAIRYKND